MYIQGYTFAPTYDLTLSKEDCSPITAFLDRELALVLCGDSLPPPNRCLLGVLGRWIPSDPLCAAVGLDCTLWGAPRPPPSDNRFSDERLSFLEERERAGSVVRLTLPEGGRTLMEGANTALELGGRGGRLNSISTTGQ